MEETRQNDGIRLRRPRIGASPYEPRPEDLRALREHAERFAEGFGVPVICLDRPERVPDSSIRSAIQKNQSIKGWYDALADAVFVYLPNIAKSGRNAFNLLDRTLIHEVVGHKGMAGLLGPQYGAYLDRLWETMAPALRQEYIDYVDGDAALEADRRAAAEEFVARTAEFYADRQYYDYTRGRWAFAMGVLRDSNAAFGQDSDLTDNDLFQTVAAASNRLRQLARYHVPDVPLEQINEDVNGRVLRLEPQLRGTVRRDFDEVFKLGMPNNTLLASSPRARNLPLELRSNALYGNEDDDKQKRHPYHAEDLRDIVRSIDEPLAVFYSKDREKYMTSVLLLRNSAEDAAGTKRHFVAPVSPIVNKEGFPVMNVDSVYPKDDIQLMYWLEAVRTEPDGTQSPRLVRYLSPAFRREWFEPAVRRIKEKYIRTLGEETVEKLSRTANGSSIPPRLLDGSLTKDEQECLAALRHIAGATKIVDSFENPKIPGRDTRLFFKKGDSSSVPAPEGPSSFNSIEEEMAAVRERTLADGTFMLSPDGSRSRLSEGEWLFARTRAFRSAYGDWEGYLLDEEVKEKGFTPMAQRLLDAQMAYQEYTGEDVLGRLPSWESPSLKIDEDLLSLHKETNEDGEEQILSERRPQGLVRKDGERDRRDVEAALVARGCGSTDSQNSPADRYEEEVSLGKRQELVLEQWARARGIWQDRIDASLKETYGKKIDDGAEADVWYDASRDEAVKVLNLSYFVSPQLALDRILIHNRIAPQAPLTIEGLGRDSEGVFRILVRQPWVRGEATTQEEADNLIKGWGQGFRKIGGEDTTEYASDILYIGDLHGANVLKTASGDCVIIDVEARINTPGLGFGGRYVIPSRDKSYDFGEGKEPKAEDIIKIANAISVDIQQGKAIRIDNKKKIQEVISTQDINHPAYKDINLDSIAKLEGIISPSASLQPKFYSGSITPDTDTVFVFGSNPEGRHGAGASRVAREHFGARYGIGEGLSGSSYALPTKDLAKAGRLGLYTASDVRWKEMTRKVSDYYASHPYTDVLEKNPYERSISPEDIIACIERLYGTALEHPEKVFKVAYTNTPEEFSLNGYCGGEMAALFALAGHRSGGIPSNVEFSEAWRDTLLSSLAETSEINNIKDKDMPTNNITFTTSGSTGYRERTIENAAAADLTLAFAVDFTTAGEKLTAKAAGSKYYPIAISADSRPEQLANAIESSIVGHYDPEGSGAAEIPELSLNIAGNGMATLSQHGLSQEFVNGLLAEALKIVAGHGYTIKSVRSGGQTGIDEAGLYAGVQLGVPTVCHVPADWKWRDAEGRDHVGEKSFRGRLDYMFKAAPKQTPYEMLVNDIAMEMSVGGDRFSPWDIAPQIRSIVGDITKMDKFRDDIRARYLETTPESLHDEKGLAFIEEQLGVWASDGIFCADYGFDSFRHVGGNVYSGFWADTEEEVLFNSKGEALHKGGIAIFAGRPGYVIQDGIISGKAKDGEGREYDVRIDMEKGMALPSVKEEKAAELGPVNIHYGNGAHPELSNFARRPFVKDGITFECVEQFFQYSKVAYSDAGEERKNEIRADILTADSPQEMRRLGRGIPELRTKEWDAVAADVMREGIALSFGQNEQARQALAATAGRTLTHEPDGSRWGRLFPEMLMAYRDTLAEELSAAEKEGKGVAAGMVYSLGKGSKSLKEFEAMHPAGFDLVVDLGSLKASYTPSRELSPGRLMGDYARWAKDLGRSIEFVSAPEVSGRPYVSEAALDAKIKAVKDDAASTSAVAEAYRAYVASGHTDYGYESYLRTTTRKRMESDLMKKVQAVGKAAGTVDYDRYVEAQPGAKEMIERIAQAYANGHKVLVLGAESDPQRSVTMRLIGQELLRRGIEMQHISLDREKNIITRGQRTVVEDAIRMVFAKGEPSGIHFDSDGKYRRDAGVQLTYRENKLMRERRQMEHSTRTANYGTPVTFSPSKENNYISSVIKAADMADLAIQVTSRQYSVNDGRTKDILGARGVRLTIPERPHDEVESIVVSRGESRGTLLQVDGRSAEALLVRAKDIARANGEDCLRVSYADADGTVRKAVVSLDGLSAFNLRETLKSIADTGDGRTVTVEVLGRETRSKVYRGTGLLDDDKIRSDARKVAQRIVEQSAVNVMQGKDAGVTLFIVGSDEAHVTTRKVDGKVGEDELSGKAVKTLSRTGLKLEDQTDISVEDVERYHILLLGEVMRQLRSSDVNRDFDAAADTEQQAYIKDIVVTGEGGVAQAAGRAGQYYGLGTTVVPTANWSRVYANDTPYGMMVPDELSIRNSYYQGLRGPATEEQIAERDDLRMVDVIDAAEAPGLTPVATSALAMLGFNNTDTRDIAALAASGAVNIHGEEGFVQFVRSLADDPVDGAELMRDDVVRDAYEKADAMLRDAMHDGIFPVMEGDGRYPVLLSGVKEFTRNVAQPTVEVVDGVVQVSTVQSHERITTPMLLWDKGNPSVLDDCPAVAFMGGGRWSLPESVSYAREFAKACMAQGIAGVFTSISGPQRAALEQMIDGGGRVVLVTTEPLDSPDIRDLADRIDRAGGRVLSTANPGEKAGRSVDWPERRQAAALASAMCGNVVMVDALTREGSLNEDARQVQGYTEGTTRITETGAEEAVKAMFLDAVRGTSASERMQEAAERALAAAADELFVEHHPWNHTFRVIRYPGQDIYVIDPTYPDVRDTVRQAYGADVRIIETKDMDRVMNELRHGTISYAGGKVNFLGDRELTDTRIRFAEPYVDNLVYHKDGRDAKAAIYSVVDAPDNAMPTPRAERREQAELFARLSAASERCMTTLKKEAGYDTPRRMQFANAYYAVVLPTSISIYKGEQLQASMWINRAGNISVRNAVKGFLPTGTGTVDSVSVKDIEARLDEWLLSTGPDRSSERFSLHRRDVDEDMDDIRANYNSGFYEQAPDNRETAARDIEEAVKAHTVCVEPGEPADRVEAMALLGRRLGTITSNLEKQRDALGKAQEKALALKETFEKAVYTGGTVEEQEKASADYNEAVAEVNGLRDMVGRLVRNEAWARYEMNAVATCAGLDLAGRDGDARELSADGIIVRISTGGRQVSEEERAAAEQTLQTLVSGREVLAVVAKAGEDINIVRGKDGRMAYADAGMNILSDWYDKISPFHEGWGPAERTEHGRRMFTLVSSRSFKDLGQWYDGIAKPAEGMAVVKLDGAYNHLDLEASASVGKAILLSDAWSEQATSFVNGHARIMAGKDDIAFERMNTGTDITGKWNLINKEGDLLTAEWYDRVSQFKQVDGRLVAQVSRDGKTWFTDPEGKNLGYVKAKGQGEDKGIGGIS